MHAAAGTRGAALQEARRSRALLFFKKIQKYVQNTLNFCFMFFFRVQKRVRFVSKMISPDRYRKLTLNGFFRLGASKIGYWRLLGWSRSRDKFVTLWSYSAATETFRPPHHTLFPRRLQKHLLLPKGCQNRYLRASNSLYS